jgi:glycosyltransferase involved in cell wall biosynthesis
MSAVEVMACGTPVICTRSSSYEETAGSGAVYIDTTDDSILKDTILEVCYNKNLRENMAERGLQQSKKYDLDFSTKKLISLYESIAYDRI